MPPKSTISKLPVEIRDLISELLSNNKTLDEIIAKLQELNVDVSRSALGRHTKKIEQVAETIKRSQIVASAVADVFGSEESSKVSRANLEFMHALIQKVMIGGEDGVEISLDPKDAMFLATALEKLGKAESTNVITRIKVAEERAKKEALKEAAKEAVSEARKQGLSADTVNAIKSRILGVEL